MEEEALADVDPAEELPVAVEIRVHGAIDRLRRKALAELVVQLARAHHDQHHELIEVVAAARNADLFAHDGMAAVAADQIIALQHLACAIPGDGDARAARVLLDLGGGPAEAALDVRQGRHLGPQHLFHLVLRQPVVLLEVVVVDQLAARGREPIFPVQVAIAGDLADREAGRQEPRRAQLIDDAHEVEMLERAMGEVLPLGNAAELGAAFHQRAVDAAHSQLHGERHADRPAAHDDDLLSFHCLSSSIKNARPANRRTLWRMRGLHGMNVE